MKTYFERFAAILLQCFAGAFMIGLLDGLVTASGGSARFAWTYLAVFGLTTSPLIVISLVFAAVAALFGAGRAVHQGPVMAVFRAVWPADPGARTRRGARMLFTVALMAVFVGASAIIGRHFVESMRTVIYATISTSLASLAIGLFLIWLDRRFLRRLERTDCTALPRFAGFLLSPPGAALILVVLASPVVFLMRDRAATILDSLPLRLPAILLAGLIFGLAAGARRPFREVPWLTRLVVLGGIPVVVAGALIVCGAGVGMTNPVRAAFTSRGIISPTAFKLARKALDFDGDGQIAFMNDGDCAPFNKKISSGATEIPNNHVDEDCDGEDLTFNPALDDYYGRWDFEVPAGIARKRYNIVMITIDAAAPDRMSLYGYRRRTTPNLEKIAAGSAWFQTAIAAGPSTRLALPEMMTSRYGPQVDRAVGYRVPLEIKPANNMMAEILKRAGYRTSAVIPTGYFSGWKGFLQGFDKVDRTAVPFDSKKHAFHSGRQVSDALIALLQAAAMDDGHPQFVWAHYYDAHSPYTKVPDWKEYGKDKADVYDSELEFVDDQIGRVVAEMDKVWDPAETILIITADHGEAFDSNHAVKHHGHDLHSTILHIPLLIRAPFVKPGVFKGPISAMDILPTLVNLTGIKGRFKFAGTSLVPQLLEGQDDMDRQVHSLFYLPENVYHRKPTHMMAGVRTARHNYFKDLENSTQYLFDYRADPYETRNLVDDMPRAGAGLRKDVSKFLLWLDANSVKREPPPDRKKKPAKPAEKGAAKQPVDAKAAKDAGSARDLKATGGTGTGAAGANDIRPSGTGTGSGTGSGTGVVTGSRVAPDSQPLSTAPVPDMDRTHSLNMP